MNTTPSRYFIDQQYAPLIESVGLSVAEVLRKAGLRADLFSAKDITVTEEEYFHFMEAIGEMMPKPADVVRMGTYDRIETFSAPIFAAFCSKNALACIDRLARFKRIVAPLRLNTVTCADHVEMQMVSYDGQALPQFMVEVEMVFLINLFRTATKANIVPLSITMTHKPKDNTLAEFFGCEVTVGDHDAFVLKKEDAELPFISENEVMWSYFEPELQKRLSDMEIDDSLSARVRSVLTELLPGGRSTVDDVAGRLNMSRRTLQRRLTEEKTTFAKQLNHVRLLLAKHYLKEGKLSSEEIAYMLGYQDMTGFTRAFGAWTGMSVGEYRKKMA